MRERLTKEREAEIEKIRNCVWFITPEAGAKETQAVFNDLLSELAALRADNGRMRRERDEAIAGCRSLYEVCDRNKVRIATLTAAWDGAVALLRSVWYRLSSFDPAFVEVDAFLTRLDAEQHESEADDA